jgi:putative transposase
LSKLQKHFAKMRKKHPYWKHLNSQTTQEVIERYDNARQRFFKKLSRHPHTKKWKNFRSFVFKQCGFKISGNHLTLNGVATYGFWLDRKIEGNIKRIALQRRPSGDWYLCVFTDKVIETDRKQGCNAHPVGLDFGLKTYLTDSDGVEWQSPQFFKKNRKRLASAQRAVSRKVKGSNNRRKSGIRLAKVYEDVVNCRIDYQWKLAHELCQRHDVICIEDLNIKAMQRLWGRKVSDLCHSEFISKLEYIATKYGTTIVKVGRFFPSSKLCSTAGCGYKNDMLSLSEREWVCPQCGTRHNRDLNAALNILIEGTSSIGIGLVRPDVHKNMGGPVIKPESTQLVG